jgi:hypothetical protein
VLLVESAAPLELPPELPLELPLELPPELPADPPLEPLAMPLEVPPPSSPSVPPELLLDELPPELLEFVLSSPPLLPVFKPCSDPLPVPDDLPLDDPLLLVLVAWVGGLLSPPTASAPAPVPLAAQAGLTAPTRTTNMQGDAARSIRITCSSGEQAAWVADLQGVVAVAGAHATRSKNVGRDGLKTAPRVLGVPGARRSRTKYCDDAARDEALSRVMGEGLGRLGGAARGDPLAGRPPCP